MMDCEGLEEYLNSEKVRFKVEKRNSGWFEITPILNDEEKGHYYSKFRLCENDIPEEVLDE